MLYWLPKQGYIPALCGLQIQHSTTELSDPYAYAQKNTKVARETYNMRISREENTIANFYAL